MRLERWPWEPHRQPLPWSLSSSWAPAVAVAPGTVPAATRAPGSRDRRLWACHHLRGGRSQAVCARAPRLAQRWEAGTGWLCSPGVLLGGAWRSPGTRPVAHAAGSAAIRPGPRRLSCSLRSGLGCQTHPFPLQERAGAGLRPGANHRGLAAGPARHLVKGPAWPCSSSWWSPSRHHDKRRHRWNPPRVTTAAAKPGLAGASVLPTAAAPPPAGAMCSGAARAARPLRLRRRPPAGRPLQSGGLHSRAVSGRSRANRLAICRRIRAGKQYSGVPRPTGATVRATRPARWPLDPDRNEHANAWPWKMAVAAAEQPSPPSGPALKRRPPVPCRHSLALPAALANRAPPAQPCQGQAGRPDVGVWCGRRQAVNPKSRTIQRLCSPEPTLSRAGAEQPAVLVFGAAGGHYWPTSSGRIVAVGLPFLVPLRLVRLAVPSAGVAEISAQRPEISLVVLPRPAVVSNPRSLRQICRATKASPGQPVRSVHLGAAGAWRLRCLGPSCAVRLRAPAATLACRRPGAGSQNSTVSRAQPAGSRQSRFRRLLLCQTKRRPPPSPPGRYRLLHGICFQGARQAAPARLQWRCKPEEPVSGSRKARNGSAPAKPRVPCQPFRRVSQRPEPRGAEGRGLGRVRPPMSPWRSYPG